MKGLIIYKGRYGATEQYALWAEEELNLPLMVADECTKGDLAKADVLILGTSVYIGILVIKEWVKLNLDALSGKKIYLFVVCGTPLTETDKLEGFVRESLPESILKNCKTYFLPGRLTFKKLSMVDKMLLRLGYFFSPKKQKKNMHLTDYDDVRKENLSGMVKDAQKELNITEQLMAII